MKELSDEGAGEAYVRNRSEGVAEVVTIRDGYRYRYLVDPAGVILDEEVDPISPGQRWADRVMRTGVVLFVLFLFTLGASVRVALAGMGVSVLAAFAGRLLYGAQHPRTVGEDRWFMLETAVPSD